MNTPTIVVDSSVIIKWLSQDNEKFLDRADEILLDAQKGKITLIAPELAKYEVGNVLLFSKNLSPVQVAVIFTKFYKLPISYITESLELANETFKLAFDLGITYYDASFVSLTKQNEAILVTENPKHQGKSKEIRVKSIKDY